MSHTVTYYNLSQCHGDRVVYFRSTDVEQKNYHRLLWSVPDEWLYLLYNGCEILVVDASKHRKGKIERVFIPVLNDLLNTKAFGTPPEHTNLVDCFVSAQNALKHDKALDKKYRFWTRRLRYEVDIKALTIRVAIEPNLIA